MTDPDETLSAIDAAIEGWNGYDDSVSDDAMRWAPEQPKREWRGAEPTLTIRDEVNHISAGPVYVAPAGTPPDLNSREWRQIGWATDGAMSEDSDRLLEEADHHDIPIWPGPPGVWSQEARVTLAPAQERALRTWAQAWVDQVHRQHTGLRRAFQRLHRHLLETAEKAHAGFAPLTYGDAYGRHRRRCRSCNPAGNPKPLKVNGADYARRRKNRRRRG